MMTVLPAFFTDFDKQVIWLDCKHSLKNKGVCTIIVDGFLYLAGGQTWKEVD